MEILNFDTLKAQFGEPGGARRWQPLINFVFALTAILGFTAMLGGLLSIRNIDDVSWSTVGVSFGGMVVFLG